MTIRFAKSVTLYLSTALFAFSLSQRCYCVDNECGELWSGLAAFLTGPLGCLLGGAGLTWLANPLLFYTWKTIRRNVKLTIILSAISTLIAISFLFFRNIVADEAGNIRAITGYQLGYWLWLASSATMFFGSLVLRILINRETN